MLSSYIFRFLVKTEDFSENAIKFGVLNQNSRWDSEEKEQKTALLRQ